MVSYLFIEPDKFYFGCEDGTLRTAEFFYVLDKFKRFNVSALVNDKVTINSFVRSENGDILIGTSKGYLVKFDPKKEELS